MMATTMATDFDYYNSHYRHVNPNFNIDRYRQIVLHEHHDVLRQDLRILDVGCGAGFLLRALEMAGYRHLWGVERDEHQYGEARRRLEHTQLVQQDALEFLSGSGQRFDVIFLYDVIEHITRERIVPLLRGAHQSLHPGGMLIIRTPNADAPFCAARMRYIDFTHQVMFNEESLKMVLRQAGFAEIACRPPRRPPGRRQFVGGLLRALANLFPRFYLCAYFGLPALRWIVTPDFITLARKQPE
jgi:2-polyprenyl-3-methyl-5-hydroxy-6-metoxy-1,4-benzoquinol methylase